ncbi:MAG: bifunctional tetrahydrofolate synthase/dihydrofolate synthase [Pseudomonadota bacterium]
MRFDSLAEWLAWQEALHPTEMDFGLDRSRAVLGRLGWPSDELPLISVAGTNGKGSTVAYLEQMFLASGYRVCAHTSPHLLRYNERIRLDGEPANDLSLVSQFAAIDAARGETSLTYFEFATLAAAGVARANQVDIALFEVGLGGRLDAVNLFDAGVAVITAIGIDHVDYLGSDREQIGAEKAGILRRGRPVVIGDRSPPASVLEAARTLDAPTYRLGVDFEVEHDRTDWRWVSDNHCVDSLRSPMGGTEVQFDNAATAIMAARLMHPSISAEAVRRGVSTARLTGRFQIVATEPEIIVDVGHNEDACGQLARSLRARPIAGRTHAVLGMLSDKQHRRALLACHDAFHQWHLATLSGSRGAAATALAESLPASVSPEHVRCYDDPLSAFKAALASAGRSDRIVVFGSFRTVGAVMNHPMISPTLNRIGY